MSNSIIRVHWLNQSRAFRVLWLLDALKLDFEIIPYKRVDGRAPDSLKKIHPLGRSPIVEIEDKSTGKKKMLIESGYIFQYMLQNFDHDNVLNNTDPDMAEKIQFYLHFAEGSIQPPLLMEYIYQLAEKSSSFPISYFVQSVVNKLSEAYSRGEVKNQFDFLESEIVKNKGYLVDGKLSAADILVSFPVEMAFLRGFVTSEIYPNTKKWLDTIKTTDSYAITKEKVKAFGEEM
ncbi:bifunctional glutathione transferase/peroxidase NDAI_0B06360 [Naumovozyma dairenensis CBS 421]|uniref:GST N-terminal domain-containing protein n=1 Tax=Naumovozyma dairenensis (strain ATCC 10597 / BCRC 20456 / CBS 421 / NBRC 0211 / NRRL Y-12639) TaxID=1071378 RepID=G0W7A6_NAUDC|nr:hypothetical protein NDAI_0B06360 [Naumovozyma dairenensis CBS 421]CCD23667.1 hypothetical protein NDAI_0B06360 [Naumovozyma dairenensis CBS 421]